MRARRLRDIAPVVDGQLVGGDAEITSVVTDSRAANPGSLFVALPGERTDGGLYLAEAFERGAAGALVRDGADSPGPAVFVRSTGEALLLIAADERRRMTARVVGVTGANGKTSTKDLAAAVVATTFNTHSSPGSFNTEVGLPMTLLGARQDVEVVVAELGARHKGDVTLLCEIARPDIVVVTNVGVAHMEIFGSWDAIVEASAEPVEAVGPGGVAVLNADDPVVAGFAERCGGRVVTYGTGSGAHVRAADVSLDEHGCAGFFIETSGEREHVRLLVPGEHMVSNALAAATVGLELGISLDAAAEALGRANVSRWRMESFLTQGGVTVLNDAYNANPESMAAALRTARWMAGDGRCIAVLGAMAELGPIADREHERVGELAARLRIDRVITVGQDAALIATAAEREGVEPENVAAYDGIDEALADVRAHAGAGDVVVCKASRVAGLERLAEALR
ncbi:MAG TPA: UDP-N-acetylmuramoyl-tripeptide--D-alanyl-D-alanine ligase [Actinomycetota bacterium]